MGWIRISWDVSHILSLSKAVIPAVQPIPLSWSAVVTKIHSNLLTDLLGTFLRAALRWALADHVDCGADKLHYKIILVKFSTT